MKNDPWRRPSELGETMRYLRGERSQSQLAACVGLTASTWSLYESGRRRPRRANYLKVLAALGATEAGFRLTAEALRQRDVSVGATAALHQAPGGDRALPENRPSDLPRPGSPATLLLTWQSALERNTVALRRLAHVLEQHARDRQKRRS